MRPSRPVSSLCSGRCSGDGTRFVAPSPASPSHSRLRRLRLQAYPWPGPRSWGYGWPASATPGAGVGRTLVPDAGGRFAAPAAPAVGHPADQRAGAGVAGRVRRDSAHRTKRVGPPRRQAAGRVARRRAGRVPGSVHRLRHRGRARRRAAPRAVSPQLAFSVDRPLELRLGHPRSPRDAFFARFIAELVIGAAFRAAMRPQPSASLRREVLDRRPACFFRLTGAGAIFVDGPCRDFFRLPLAGSALLEAFLDVFELSLALRTPGLLWHAFYLPLLFSSISLVRHPEHNALTAAARMAIMNPTS